MGSRLLPHQPGWYGPRTWGFSQAPGLQAMGPWLRAGETHKSPELRPCRLLTCVATHTFWTPSLELACAAAGEISHISLAQTQGPLDERLQEASCWGNVPRTSEGPAVQRELRRARGEEGPTSSPIWLTGWWVGGTSASPRAWQVCPSISVLLLLRSSSQDLSLFAALWN